MNSRVLLVVVVPGSLQYLMTNSLIVGFVPSDYQFDGSGCS